MVGGELLHYDLEVDIVTDGVVVDVPGEGGGEHLGGVPQALLLANSLGIPGQTFCPTNLC